ncbi:MAG: hypothetical protein AB7R89_28280 [Dehalococcoidia bacterium]
MTTNNHAVTVRPHEAPDLFRLGSVLASSGYFKDAKEEAQAVVKVLAGQEIGIGPVAAMVGIYVVEGKPTFSARLMASLVKRSGRYNYRVKTTTDQECAIEFFEGGESIGVSTFTIKDAERAGLAGRNVWKQYPRNLLFARAMSNGFNMFTPDLSNGMPVYTPEELNVAVDGETGEVIEATARTVEEPPSAETKPAVPMITRDQMHAILTAGKSRGITPETIEETSRERFGVRVRDLTAAQGEQLLAAIEEMPVSAADLPIDQPDANPAKREPPLANDRQVAAIYEAGGAAGYDQPETDRLCAVKYDGRVVASLTSREASAFLTALREG